MGNRKKENDVNFFSVRVAKTGGVDPEESDDEDDKKEEAPQSQSPSQSPKEPSRADERTETTKPLLQAGGHVDAFKKGELGKIMKRGTMLMKEKERER
jgi:hypothetical protein